MSRYVNGGGTQGALLTSGQDSPVRRWKLRDPMQDLLRDPIQDPITKQACLRK